MGVLPDPATPRYGVPNPGRERSKDIARAIPTPKTVVKLVQISLDADKAENILVIDLAGKSSMADFMVVASGQSSRQLGAMTEHLVGKLKAKGIKPVPVEGQSLGEWVLVDAGDVIVHLFRPEVRTFYNLEKMWNADLAESSTGAEAVAG